MSHKKYSSYDEIEHDLDILKLEREIQRQKISLHFEKAKQSLTLPNVVEGYLGFSEKSSTHGIGRIVTWLIPFVLKWFNRKDETSASNPT